MKVEIKICKKHSALPPIGIYELSRNYEEGCFRLSTQNTGYSVDYEVYEALQEAGFISDDTN